MKSAVDYTRIIDSVLNPDPNDVSPSIIYSTTHTTVFRVEACGSYAVRVSALQAPAPSIRIRILQNIGSLDGRIATILHSENRAGNEHPCTIDIMPFLPGVALDRFPSSNEIRGIIETTYALHRGLKRVSPSFVDSEIPNVKDILHGLLATALPGRMRSRAKMLLADERFMQLLTSEDQCLLYGDPWPANFLIEAGANAIRARIVDIDPIFIGPSILQPALLFSACFVASSVLFENEEESPNLDALIHVWPEEIDRDDIVKMMRVYPILLSLVKLAESGAESANLRLLERCLEIVDAYG